MPPGEGSGETFLLVLLAGAFLPLALVGYFMILGSKIATEQGNLQAAQSENTGLQAQIATLQVFADLEAEVQAKEAALVTVMAGDLAWPAILTEVALVVPGEVWLTNLTASAALTEGEVPVGTETAPVDIEPLPPSGRVAFSGSSLSMSGVAQWLIRLGLAKKIDVQAVYLLSASESEVGTGTGGPEVVTFDSTIELGPKALSGRFQRGTP